MTLHQAYQKVLKSFGNNAVAAMAWFNEPLFEFKHKTPNEMIAKNKKIKVIEYIEKNF